MARGQILGFALICLVTLLIADATIDSSRFKQLTLQVEAKPIRQYPKGEHRVYPFIGTWLVDKGWCDSVTASWPSALDSVSVHPDLVGVPKRGTWTILTEVKMSESDMSRSFGQLVQHQDHSDITFLALEHDCPWLEKGLSFCESRGIGLVTFEEKSGDFTVNQLLEPMVRTNSRII